MSAFLNPPAAQALRFTAAAVRQAQSANYHQGEDIRLHLVVRGHEGRPHLIVNDQIGGVWGAELRLPLEEGTPLVGVAFTAAGILITPPGGPATPFRPERPVPQALLLRRGPAIELEAAPLPEAPAPVATLEGDGVIDALAPLPGTGHSFALLRLADAALEAALTATPLPVRDAQGNGAAPALAVGFDAGEGQLGLLLALPGDSAPRAALELLPPGLGPLRLTPGERPLPAEFLPRLQARLAESRGPARATLEALLAQAFTGRDTLGWLSAPVGLDLRLVLAPAGHVLLAGTLRDPHCAIAGIRLCHAEAQATLRPGGWLDTSTWEGDARGFVASAPWPQAARLGEAWVEIRLRSGGVGVAPLPPPIPADLAGLRAMLTAAGHIPGDALDHAFDAVLGPPLVALHQARLAQPMAVERRDFGPLPEAPRASLVIPLHGRLDMLPVQVALFSACGMERDEVILVLDDPPRRAAAVALAESLWRRFGVPLSLVLPAAQRGFGAASNLGLAHARGEVVCFLNSDAFPEGQDWLDQLCAALADPTVGMAGARLIYPDGSLQHGGMAIGAAPHLGGWRFPEHPGKGMRPPPAAPALRDVEAVTGACMALRREVAERLGGFDPGYVIGDFEDADLCARVLQAGLRCVMQDQAVLTHLERQSQGDPGGRWNLTLLNAWTYNRRWHG